MSTVISLNNVSKKFSYLVDRQTSVKNVLINLTKGRMTSSTYREIEVLKNISFEVKAGEFVGIVGRNGVGKSTILKIISKIYTPTSGSVEINGTIAPMIEVGAGFDGDLSGYENIFLNAAILGFGRAVTMQAVDKIIEFSELGEKINMPVKNYSSGMLVRLGFSVATHLDAPTVLVDEVLAVGDMGFQKKCLNKIKEIHGNGRTIVLVTHAMSEIRKHCQRCIFVNNQGVEYDGDPEEAAKRYEKLF